MLRTSKRFRRVQGNDSSCCYGNRDDCDGDGQKPYHHDHTGIEGNHLEEHTSRHSDSETTYGQSNDSCKEDWHHLLPDHEGEDSPG